MLTFSRTKEKLQSGELAVSGDQWPIFVYHGYNYDPEDPWNGLFRSILLVSVGCSQLLLHTRANHYFAGIQAYIYIAELCRKRA